MLDHEGGAGAGTGDESIFSPWMCAIMFNSYFRAFMFSENNAYAQFIADHGTAFESSCRDGVLDSQTMTLPWYCAGGQLFTDAGIWGDVEHVTDVIAAVGMILWAKAQVEEVDTATLEALEVDITRGLGYNQASWYRNAQATYDAGYPVWRCTPPRRPLWQHIHSANYRWLKESRESV